MNAGPSVYYEPSPYRKAMGFHTFDPEKTDRLSDPTRFRFCSREELIEPLPANQGARILDIGSGIGFYTDELAPYFETVYAFDLQEEMHQQYRNRGVPENVELVTGDAGSLPFETETLDGAFSTMTFHESTTPESLSELANTLTAGSPFVIVDWSGEGDGEAGPPLEERFSAAEANELLEDAGFTVTRSAERTETFVIVAHAVGSAE